MKFYEKIGNDLFAPNISVFNILLDNQVSSEQTTNGIIVDSKISSKLNNIDNWIGDTDYLQYTTINYIVFENSQYAQSFETAINNKQYVYSSINEIANSISGTLVNTVNIADITDLQSYSQSEPNFETFYSPSFTSIDSKNDIILYIVPSINFSSFFEDNGIDVASSQELVNEIYSIEIHKFNILVKNKTSNDNLADQILSDVRQIKQLRTNILNLIPVTINQTEIINEKPSYIPNIFSTFDYDNKLTRSYFFFDINTFIKNNTVFDRLLETKSKDEINSILLDNNSVIFTITKNLPDSEEIIDIFYTSLNTINGASNTIIIESLTTEDFVCYSFTEETTNESRQNFTYTVTVNYADPFLNQYYEPLTQSGKYYSVVDKTQQIENFVNNPNNTDATTGKFVNYLNLDYLTSFAKDFFELVNLFSDKTVDDATITKIVNALNPKKVSYSVYNDFIAVVKEKLIQIEQLFVSCGQTKTSYSKNSDSISYTQNGFYFKLDTFQFPEGSPKLTIPVQQMNSNMGVRYYIDSNENKQYDLQSSTVDATNVVSYKIANSVVSARQPEITYSSDYSFLSDILNLGGTTIEKQTNYFAQKQDIVPLFNKISISNPTVQQPAEEITNSSKEMKSYMDDIASTKIGTLINKISITKQLDTLTTLEFQMLYLNQMSDSFLIPQMQIQIYNPIMKKWQTFTPSNNSTTNTYFARTIYIQNNNIFSNNKVVPPLTNNYFIVETKTS